MNGKEKDFDPDALCQNLVVGLIGYHTEDGTSRESWENPDNLPTDGVVYADRAALAERCEKLREALQELHNRLSRRDVFVATCEGVTYKGWLLNIVNAALAEKEGE